ncbi:MAG: hypothetical protein MUC97_19260 [Bernardetiaceae bacterium]|nr:hypothetical protein [Bernardetiaceae bacterium]
MIAFKDLKAQIRYQPKRRWWLAPFAWISGRAPQAPGGEPTPHDDRPPVTAGAGLAVGRTENLAPSAQAAAGPNAQGGWEPLALDYTADSTVTLRVGVANPGAAEAYFDLLGVEQEPPLIVQENHYDPWGLELVGITGQGNPPHYFMWQGKERELRLAWNWTILARAPTTLS